MHGLSHGLNLGVCAGLKTTIPLLLSRNGALHSDELRSIDGRRGWIGGVLRHERFVLHVLRKSRLFCCLLNGLSGSLQDLVFILKHRHASVESKVFGAQFGSAL